MPGPVQLRLCIRVALLAEGVDRNSVGWYAADEGGRVALLAEGVDRNGVEDQLLWTVAGLSPSSRRAWIEILQDMDSGLLVWVALLAEGVDRNCTMPRSTPTLARSPSSRRAWIEISAVRAAVFVSVVALLAEGVDRNQKGQAEKNAGKSRPPRGGRG